MRIGRSDFRNDFIFHCDGVSLVVLHPSTPPRRPAKIKQDRRASTPGIISESTLPFHLLFRKIRLPPFPLSSLPRISVDSLEHRTAAAGLDRRQHDPSLGPLLRFFRPRASQDRSLLLRRTPRLFSAVIGLSTVSFAALGVEFGTGFDERNADSDFFFDEQPRT